MRNEIKINGWKWFLWFYDDSSINYCYSNCEILVYILGLPTVQCCIVHIIIIIIQITRLDRIITCWCMENLAKIVWSTWRIILFWVCKVNGSIYWVFYFNYSNFYKCCRVFVICKIWIFEFFKAIAYAMKYNRNDASW